VHFSYIYIHIRFQTWTGNTCVKCCERSELERIAWSDCVRAVVSIGDNSWPPQLNVAATLYAEISDQLVSFLCGINYKPFHSTRLFLADRYEWSKRRNNVAAILDSSGYRQRSILTEEIWLPRMLAWFIWSSRFLEACSIHFASTWV
jgi:hypothetical protein